MPAGADGLGGWGPSLCSLNRARAGPHLNSAEPVTQQARAVLSRRFRSRRPAVPPQVASQLPPDRVDISSQPPPTDKERMAGGGALALRPRWRGPISI